MRTLLRVSSPILLLPLIALLGCAGEEPTRPVQFGPGMIDMAIAEAWELEASTEAGRVYVHRDHGDLRLSFDTRTETFGQPMRVPEVKSIVGRELNGRYGGVIARVSLGGNAMLRYSTQEAGEDARPIHREAWVLAKPVGWGDIARVEIDLRMPAERKDDPAVVELVEQLDRRVGDARIPRA